MVWHFPILYANTWKLVLKLPTRQRYHYAYSNAFTRTLNKAMIPVLAESTPFNGASHASATHGRTASELHRRCEQDSCQCLLTLARAPTTGPQHQCCQHRRAPVHTPASPSEPTVPARILVPRYSSTRPSNKQWLLHAVGSLGERGQRAAEQWGDHVACS